MYLLPSFFISFVGIFFMYYQAQSSLAYSHYLFQLYQYINIPNKTTAMTADFSTLGGIVYWVIACVIIEFIAFAGNAMVFLLCAQDIFCPCGQSISSNPSITESTKLPGHFLFYLYPENAI